MDEETFRWVIFGSGVFLGAAWGGAIVSLAYTWRSTREILRRRRHRIPRGDGGYPPVVGKLPPPPPLPPEPLRAMTPEERGEDFRRSYYGVVRYKTPPVSSTPTSQRFVDADDPSIDARIAELRRTGGR